MSTLSNYYTIFVAVHIAFMVTWFAGLFYLPRLFIYHAEAEDTVGRQRFTTMERKLFAIMTIGAVLTVLFGIILVGINHSVVEFRWFQAKLGLVVALIAYHVRCYVWIQRLQNSAAVINTNWLRWFNEIPVFFLFTIILLVVTKAF